MQVIVRLEFRADKKEPLGELTRRVMAAFDAAGLTPEMTAVFRDGPIPGGVSAVARALKKRPELAVFEHVAGAVRCLTSEEAPGAMPFEAILALADGVPRSLPFHAVSIHFGHPVFGVPETPTVGPFTIRTGVTVSDNWWVDGRNRLLAARYAVEGNPDAKRLPPPPPQAEAVLAAFGKPRKSTHAAPQAVRAPLETPSATPEAAAAREIVARYRAEMPALLARLEMPHDLPSPSEIGHFLTGGGPLKPALVAALEPRGYDCRGGQGVFTLRRRTAKQHVVDLVLDVGTWSRSLTALYVIQSPGWRVSLRLPVSRRALDAGQYPIGDVANWERIVANLAVIVDELDRTLASEIDAAVAPTPEWFEPNR